MLKSRYTRSTRPRARLVCFPHAGGSASFYYPWRAFVPPDVEVTAVQYPGRHDRLSEPCIDTMDELVRGLLRELDQVGDVPTIFVGHSMGASVAYECLLRMSWSPKLLVASARTAPSLGRGGTLHLKDDGELLAELEKLGGFEAKEVSDPELLELVMPALRADYRLIESYQPDCAARACIPILGAVGADDLRVSVADVRAWEHATTGAFDVTVYPGDHFYIRQHGHTLVQSALHWISPNDVPS